MDTQLRPCHILIAGGGVAGLTLALALEKHNISYTLLESYPNLIPKVGAGICLLPNGLRILDQLGCYEDLRGRVGANNVLEAVYVRDHHGTELHISHGWKERMEARYLSPSFHLFLSARTGLR
jgi:2-polyprenyl-6-methoxyphenol hydroxylase-like FAD-dependent oxidoreductase